MSAIIPEDGEGVFEPVKVLFALHQGLDALDFIGPLEILSNARHDPKDKSKFHCLSHSSITLHEDFDGTLTARVCTKLAREHVSL